MATKKKIKRKVVVKKKAARKIKSQKTIKKSNRKNNAATIYDEFKKTEISINKTYALLSFLNQPILNRQLLTSTEFETNKISEKIVDNIIKHRKKIGAFVTINDLLEVPSINSTIVQNLINLAPSPTVLTRQSIGNFKNVPLNFLAGIRAFALWWGPIIPAFKWEKIPQNWNNPIALFRLADLKKSILDEKLAPLERKRKKAEAHHDSMSGLHAANNPGVITTKRLRDKARAAEKKVLDEIKELNDHIEFDEKKDAWKIIKPNIKEYIGEKEEDVDQLRLERSLEKDPLKKYRMREDIRELREHIRETQAGIDQVDAHVATLP